MSDDHHGVFLEQLRAMVAEKCSEVSGDFGEERPGNAFREEAFTQVVLETLEDLGQISGFEICYFDKLVGRRRTKVNGWHYEDEEAQLDIAATVFRDARDSENIPRHELLRAIKEAGSLWEVALQGFFRELEPASSAFDMLQRVHQVQNEIERVRLLILVDGFAPDVGEVDVRLDGVEVQLDVWDHRRLSRAKASGLPYEPIVVDLAERLGTPLPCVELPEAGPDTKVYLAIIPGTLLHNLYHEFGPRILELNVRSFLMLRGKVNKGIRKTLLEEPGRFLAYNNGLSITAESVQMAMRHNGAPAITSITGPQIVNGGQTVATIHRTRQADIADLSEVFVQAKITIVPPDQIDDLVPLISRYANTQNRVNEADFSANSTFHVSLQKLSETVWCPGETSRWFYERARGQYQVARARESTTPTRRRAFDERAPTQQKFDKVLVAKYVNAWDHMPYVVGRGGQKNFASFTQNLAKERGSDWDPDVDYYKRLVAKAIIYREAERCARTHGFSGYRANAVAYTVALFSWRTAGRVDLMKIWNEQELSDAVQKVLHDWMPAVHEALVATAGSRNVTEWCKRAECWREIQTLDLELPASLQAELAEGQPLPNVGSQKGREGGLTEEEREDIAHVMQIDAEGWLSIVRWGHASGELKTWETGIATTLASYAAMDWNKVPSAKQAKHGNRILASAREHGVQLTSPSDG